MLVPYLGTSYKWDWIVLPKNKEINKEVYIPGLLEVTVTEGCLMEGDASIEPCDF